MNLDELINHRFDDLSRQPHDRDAIHGSICRAIADSGGCVIHEDTVYRATADEDQWELSISGREASDSAPMVYELDESTMKTWRKFSPRSEWPRWSALADVMEAAIGSRPPLSSQVEVA